MRDRMKHTSGRILIAAIAILVGGCSSNHSGKVGSTRPAPVETTASSVVQLVDVAEGMALVADPSVVVIDVRTPAEFAEGHLDRATLVDFSAPGFRERIARLDHSAKYFVYCHSGNRSGQATAILAELGFTNVYNLHGGLNAWVSAGAPVIA